MKEIKLKISFRNTCFKKTVVKNEFLHYTVMFTFEKLKETWALPGTSPVGEGRKILKKLNLF